MAENRLRVKGRFVTKDQAVKLLTEHSRKDLESMGKKQLQKLLKEKFKKQALELKSKSKSKS